MTDHLVGLTFDDRSVRGVELRTKGRFGRVDGHHILRVGRTDLPSGVVEQGVIVDVDAFADRLRVLWADAGFGTKRAAIGLDTHTTTMRRADLPALEPSELRQAAAYEIGELLHYPLDQALVSAIDVTTADGTAAETRNMLVLAVEDRVVVDVRRAVREAGLQVVSTEVIEASLVASVTEPGSVGSEAVGFLVDVSETVTNVIAYDEGGLLFSRTVSAGLGAAESSLADELQIELSMLSGFDGDASDARRPGASRAGGATAPGIATVVDGVRSTVRYFGEELDDRPVRRLVLCGACSTAQGLAFEMGEIFPDVEVMRYETTDWPNPVIESSEFDQAMSVAATATSAARRGRFFDVEPVGEKTRRADRRRAVVGAAAALAITPFLLSNALEARASSQDDAAAAEVVELRVEALRGELAGYDDDQERQARADEQSARVADLQRQDLGFPTVVRQLAEAMPSNTFLVSVRTQRSQTDDAPIGYAGPPPPGVVTLTGVASDLDGVGRWLESAEEVPMLDGLWLAQSTAGPYLGSDRTATVFTVDGAIVDTAAVSETRAD